MSSYTFSWPKLSSFAPWRMLGHRQLILGASTLMLGYALAVLFFVLHLPDIGLTCTMRMAVNRVEPDRVRLPAGTTPADLIEMTVEEIGNEPVLCWPQWTRWLREIDELTFPSEADGKQQFGRFKDADGERWVRIQLRGPDRETVVWGRVGLTAPSIVLPSLLWFVLEAGLFLVAAIVFWKRPRDEAARMFFFQALIVIGAYMGGYHWSRITAHPALICIYIVCAVLLPAVNLHLYLQVPSPRKFLYRRPLATFLAVYGVPIAFMIVLLGGYAYVRWVARSGADPVRITEALDVLRFWIVAYLGVAAIWYLASIVALAVGYRFARDALERNQSRLMLMGSLAALLPIGYSWYLANWRPVDFGAGAAIWPMFAASACFTFAFAVGFTRYRFLQFDQLLNSGLAYVLVSVLAALVYCFLVLAGMLLFGTSGPSLDQAAWVAGSSLVLSIGLDAGRARLRNYLDRRYRRDKTQLDTILARLGEAVEQLVDVSTLATRLLQVSAELLGYARGTVFIRNNVTGGFELAGSLGFDGTAKTLDPDGPLLGLLKERPVLERTALPPLHPARLEMFANAGDIAVALVNEKRLIGILLLARTPGTPAIPDSPRLLASFAPIASLALAGAEVRNSVEGLNRELQVKVEKISEQQRRILSLQQQLISQSRRLPLPEPGPTATEPIVTESPALQAIVGSSPALTRVLELVPKIAANYSAVLVRGESGTGKELVAKALHEMSPRAGGPFVKVHCAALAPGVLESELFGHVKGAFTGALRDKPGRFEAANNGTLFLDEIGDIGAEVQTKLLRVLQEKTFERVGSNEPIRVDVRLVTATHQDLERLIREGRFRADLYYRLNVIALSMPALRERAEDVLELAHHFLRAHAERCRKPIEAFDDDALVAIRDYQWPGNIRELENAVERAVVVAEGTILTVDDLPAEVRRPRLIVERSPRELATIGARQSSREVRAQREREELIQALTTTGGNRTEAARMLGLARSTLLARLKKHGLLGRVDE